MLSATGAAGSTLSGRRCAAIDAGGYDVLRLLDEFPSCSLNVFEFLQVAQPLRPRYYSTSSSPRIHGDGVAHLTVGLDLREKVGRHCDVLFLHDAVRVVQRRLVLREELSRTSAGSRRPTPFSPR